MIKPLKINLQQVEALKERYNSFTVACNSIQTDIPKIKKDFARLNRIYCNNGIQDTFLKNTETLSNNLQKDGKLHLSNILYNELAKIYRITGKYELAEAATKKSLEISNILDDKLHVFARLTDLEFLYRDSNNKKKLFKVLKEKIKCAQQILANYEEYTSKFKSIFLAPARENNIKNQLAFAYADLAEIVYKQNPQYTLSLINKAKNIFKEIGRTKEYEYLSVKEAMINSM